MLNAFKNNFLRKQYEKLQMAPMGKIYQSRKSSGGPTYK